MHESHDNSSKPCSVCREVKTSAEYSKNKRKTDGLQSSCKKCSAAGSARWYKENPQTRVTQNRYQRGRNKAFVDRYKRLHGKCTDCGITDPRVLQFDHLSDKHKNVSDMIYQGNSIKLIKNEMRKCAMRCANCHSIITQQRKDNLEPL